MILPIYPGNEEQRRIAFFDRLLTYGSDELNEVIEADEIICKLKGQQPTQYGTIKKLVDNNNALHMEIVDLQSRINQLQGDLITTKADLSVLVKTVHSMMQTPYNGEWNTLKQKNGVY